jgi:hypothetical protein
MSGANAGEKGEGRAEHRALKLFVSVPCSSGLASRSTECDRFSFNCEKTGLEGGISGGFLPAGFQDPLGDVYLEQQQQTRDKENNQRQNGNAIAAGKL